MNKKRIGVLLIGIIVIVGAIIAGMFITRGQSSGGYEAVFLTNNQVYFGKISDKNSQYVVLSDIYYIQVTQPLQSQSVDKAPQASLNLVKLGNELHGPGDEMRINRDHILFIENLKTDSQVVKAIESYKSSNR